MAKGSFIIHIDSLAILDDLDDTQAGQLLRMISNYQKGIDYICPDPVIKIAFAPFKAQFIRDGVNYLKVVERNRNNGSKGGRRSNPTEPNETQIIQSVILEPKQADSDNDSKKDKGSVSVKERKKLFGLTLEPFESIYGRDVLKEFFKYWTEDYGKTGNKFRREAEKSWTLKSRLERWARNNKNTVGQTGTGVVVTQALKQAELLNPEDYGSEKK